MKIDLHRVTFGEKKAIISDVFVGPMTLVTNRKPLGQTSSLSHTNQTHSSAIISVHNTLYIFINKAKHHF